MAANEVDIGTTNLKYPKVLSGNKNALKKWKFVTKLYKDANLEIVKDADIEILIRYCLYYNEHTKLIEERDEHQEDIDSITKYINALTKIGDKMLKYEDLLYLTPASRAKGINQKKEKESSPLEKKGFDNL